MNWRAKLGRQDGFTLAEAIVAVMVLGIALGACILSFSMAMRTVNTASNQMTTLHYARYEMEWLRTLNFTNTLLSAGSHAISNANFGGTYVVTNIDSWTKDVTVNVPYLNRIHRGYSTNILVTSLVVNLHPPP